MTELLVKDGSIFNNNGLNWLILLFNISAEKFAAFVRLDLICKRNCIKGCSGHSRYKIIVAINPPTKTPKKRKWNRKWAFPKLGWAVITTTAIIAWIPAGHEK